MNNQRIAILFAAGLGMLATFLPWIHVPIVGSIDGIHGKGHGWFTFILYLITLIIYVVSKQSEPVSGTRIIIAVTTSLYASMRGLSEISQFNSEFNGKNSVNPFAKALIESVSIEVGLYLVILAGIGVTIAILFIEDPTELNIKEQMSSPPKPNEIIKIKIKKQQTLGTFFLVAQSLGYLEYIMNIYYEPAKQFDNAIAYFFFNLWLIIAIILFIRVYFLRRKFYGENINANSNISDVQNVLNVSPASDANTSDTNSHIEKISKLKELKELLDTGILSQQEYDNEKAKILS